MLFHNLPSFIRLFRFLVKTLVLFLWFILKSLNQTWSFHGLYLLSYSFYLVFLIVQWIIFAELLLDQHLILLVYSNQLLLISNDFHCIHNPPNILQYDFRLVLLLIFLFLQIFLCQNQLVGHKGFSINNDTINLDNTFWQIISFGFIPFWVIILIWIN